MGPGFESPKVHQNKNIEYLFNVFVYRGIAQLVESRSPKPLVLGSSPSAPAKAELVTTPLSIFNAVLAQRTEHSPAKRKVVGSNPTYDNYFIMK